MTIYFSILIIFSILDIITLYIKKSKKELILYVILVIMAISVGVWFKYNEYGDRLYIIFARMLNLKE